MSLMLSTVLDFVTSSPFLNTTVFVVLALWLGIAVLALIDV